MFVEAGASGRTVCVGSEMYVLIGVECSGVSGDPRMYGRVLCIGYSELFVDPRGYARTGYGLYWSVC